MSPIAIRVFGSSLVLMLLSPISADACTLLRTTALEPEAVFEHFEGISFGTVIEEKFTDSQLVALKIAVSETIKGERLEQIVVPMRTDGLSVMCRPIPPKKGEAALVVFMKDFYRIETFDPSSPYAGSLRALRAKATSNSTAEPDERKGSARRSP